MSLDVQEERPGSSTPAFRVPLQEASPGTQVLPVVPCPSIVPLVGSRSSPPRCVSTSRVAVGAAIHRPQAKLAEQKQAQALDVEPSVLTMADLKSLRDELEALGAENLARERLREALHGSQEQAATIRDREHDLGATRLRLAASAGTREALLAKLSPWRSELKRKSLECRYAEFDEDERTRVVDLLCQTGVCLASRLVQSAEDGEGKSVEETAAKIVDTPKHVLSGLLLLAHDTELLAFVANQGKLDRFETALQEMKAGM